MQERFKFRLWNGDEMHYNDFVVTSTGFVGKITEEFLGNCVFNQQDLSADKDCEIMQCTGLKDKTEKLIYEGDIVYKKGNKDHRGNKMFSTVVWCSMYAEFNISDENGLHRMPGNPNNVEIIGNIYESPELLRTE